MQPKPKVGDKLLATAVSSYNPPVKITRVNHDGTVTARSEEGYNNYIFAQQESGLWCRSVNAAPGIGFISRFLVPQPQPTFVAGPMHNGDHTIVNTNTNEVVATVWIDGDLALAQSVQEHILNQLNDRT